MVMLTKMKGTMPMKQINVSLHRDEHLDLSSPLSDIDSHESTAVPEVAAAARSQSVDGPRAPGAAMRGCGVQAGYAGGKCPSCVPSSKRYRQKDSLNTVTYFGNGNGNEEQETEWSGSICIRIRGN